MTSFSAAKTAFGARESATPGENAFIATQLPLFDGVGLRAHAFVEENRPSPSTNARKGGR